MVPVKKWHIEQAIWMMIILITLPLIACAETILYDCHGELREYAERVAVLNQSKSVAMFSGISKGEERITTMLCRTDGREIDFDVFDPTYVVAGPKHCFTIFFQTEELCRKAIERLTDTEGILYAEADSDVRAVSYQRDELDYPSGTFHSWVAEKMRFGDYLSFVAEWGQGSETVAVIDSGVFPHPLIQGRLRYGGYDYVDADEDTSNDMYGHGTNVAGIIVDCTKNNDVWVYPIRVLNASGGGKMSNVVNAVREAKEAGVGVINLSIESTTMSQALDVAIHEVVSAGITVVVAAGNSNVSTNGICPAHLMESGIIVVGAAEENAGSYERASYSNYGASVDVYVFGSGISCCSISGGYSSETGTSMAAPHVTAFCALLHLVHPGLSPGRTEARVKMIATGSGEIRIPFLSEAIPRTRGFRLTDIVLSVGEQLQLPRSAFPESAGEPIQYLCSDEEVLSVNEGLITGKTEGQVQIEAFCLGLEKVTIMVTVSSDKPAVLYLPDTLTTLEEKAFARSSTITGVKIPSGVKQIGKKAFDDCTSLRWIYLPPSVTRIGENTFSGAVILCSAGSYAADYAERNALQFLYCE